MKKSLFVLFCLAAFLTLVPATAHLQAQVGLIPNVYIDGVKLTKAEFQPGDIVSGTFKAMTDTSSAASDIYFKISLAGGYQKNVLASSFYDSTTTKSYNFKAGESKVISFSYVVPQIKSGAGYGIQVQAMTHAGVPLGWSDAFIKITNAKGVQHLDVVSSKFTVGSKSFGFQDGPMISNVSKPVFSITISNPTSQDITVTPNIKLYSHVVLGDPVLIQTASSTTITSNKQKQISISLPTNNFSPEVYVARISFLDNNNVEILPSFDVRYIVPGDIATIHSVVTDKKILNKGDDVAVTLSFSGTPFDIVTGKNPVVAVYDTKITLTDGQKQELATWVGSIDYNATSTKTVVLNANQPANGYAVNVVVSKAGKEISNYSTNIAPEVGVVATSTPATSSPSNVIYYFVGGLIILIVIIVVLVIAFRRNKNIGMTMLVLILAAGICSVYFNYSKTEKAEAYVTPLREVSYSWDDLWATGVYKTIVTSSFPVPSTTKTFFPGESFFAANNVVAAACANNIPTISTEVSLNDEDGKQVFHAGPTYDHSGMDGEHLVYMANSGQHSYLITIPIDATPGVYSLNTDVKMYWFGTGVLKSEWKGVQEITVEAPATPTPTAAIDGYCVATSTSSRVGDVFTWTAYPTGGSGNYQYSWDITGGTLLSGSINANPLLYSYSTKGTYFAVVNVYDGDGHMNTFSCPSTLVSDPKDSSVLTSCQAYINNERVSTSNVGQSVTWSVLGTKQSNYVWSGDGVVGSPSASSLYKISYPTIGKKKMSLVSKTGLGLTEVPCVANGHEYLQVVNNPNFKPF